ncbi:MAG: hypothetical protein IJ794_03955 [Lachnospiraceae bacterium]|nr:hypothetical protein [Lachnospiraceae bacterium]
MMTIDTTNMCSHLQKKLFEEDGIYHSLWIVMQDDPELTAVVRSRQLHIYRNGKKILVLAGKSTPKIIRDPQLHFSFYSQAASLIREGFRIVRATDIRLVISFQAFI